MSLLDEAKAPHDRRAPLPEAEKAMNRCAQCKQPIHGEFVRLDAGVRLGTDIAFDILDRDINLHTACHGPWMLQHYPWLVDTFTRERTRID